MSNRTLAHWTCDYPGFVLLLFSKSEDFDKVKHRQARVCVCVCVGGGVHMCGFVCLSVCFSLANDSSETIDVIIKLDTVTVSDMTMHHVLIKLTLNFIRADTYLNFFFLNRLVQKLFKQCPSSLQVYYNLFSVRWP